MRSRDYIWDVPGAVPPELCDELRRFVDEFQKYSDRSHYGKGENTNCRNLTLYETLDHPDPAYRAAHVATLAKVRAALTGIVEGVVAPAIRPLMAPVFSPIQLRKMFGPTRVHFDNVSPTLLGDGDAARFASRIVTFVLTLSETEDELVFPRQERSVKLRKGSAVLFPPYWMYEHYTTSPDVPGAPGRYSLTTWLCESSPVMRMDSVALSAPQASAPEAPSAIAAAPEESGTTVFRLPEPLKRYWWDRAAEELMNRAPARPGFDTFVREFKDFARQRGLPLTFGQEFDVLARAPGDSGPAIPVAEQDRIACLVNLGDEPTVVHAGATRITLESGDGCWVPDGTPLTSGDTLRKTDLEVLLVVRSTR